MKFKIEQMNREDMETEYLKNDEHTFRRFGKELTLEEHNHRQRGGTEFAKDVKKGNFAEIEKRKTKVIFGTEERTSYTELANKKNEMNKKLNELNQMQEELKNKPAEPKEITKGEPDATNI
ncbi:MAG: hypothetical protein [Microvirus sp.]|nr:MAG: hypothetical protein [Microvirus sp.]